MNTSREFPVNPYLLTGAMCAIALALRWIIARDAFWLDEIWSYFLPGLMTSSWDAFSTIRIDNNHLLNTLSIYWLGEQTNWTIYRLPALAFGVLLVALMGPSAKLIGAKPWVAMTLATVSIPLIQYSAEARGYSSAALFALASWYILYSRILISEQRILPLIAFWGACTLGALSHLTFVFVFAALGITWLTNCFVNRQLDQQVLLRGMLAFSIPTIFFVWLYFYFYSQTSAGGAEESLYLFDNFVELGRMISGAPRMTLLALSGSAVVMALGGYGLLLIDKVQQRFFLLAIVLVPGLLLGLYQPDFFYPRYLLVTIPFIYLLIARAISEGLNSTATAKYFAIAALIATVFGSMIQYTELAQWGKGDYPKAVSDLYKNAANGNFTVGSDFDFRNKALLDFYTRHRTNSERMTYIERSYEQDQPTDFFITHNQEYNFKPDLLLSLKNGDYRLVGEYPFAGLSGWNWYLYQHEPSN